jgi:hypothetical protein
LITIDTRETAWKWNAKRSANGAKMEREAQRQRREI